MDTGALLRRTRLAAGLSQQELAMRSGTSQATISAYESGSKDPSSATLMRILAAAGYCLEVARAAAPVRTPSRAELDRRGRTLLQVIELAELLPVHHEPDLRFPALGPAA